MTDALVVPIRVEALPVGERDSARAVGPHADFAAVAGRYSPYVGAQVASRRFSAGRPLEPGVHVHWHLPRALLRARITADGESLSPPPPAPDRWLVARLCHADVQAWVIESTYVADAPLYSETTFPRDPAEGGRPYIYVGRAYPLREWLEQGQRGTYLPRLTALGYGIPEFAGGYQNCRNVFGLHDRGPAEEEGPHTLTYAVVGWHSDPAIDPLAGGGDPEALGWQAQRGPERTLYVGSIHDVPFDPAGGHLLDQQVALTPRVAVGNSPAEALAALAAGDDPGRQRLFTAFQLGALHQLGSLTRVEERVHAATFASVHAGSVWDIAPVAGAAADAGLAERLSELNARQREYDVLRAELTTLRRRVFADWYRRAQLRAARWRPQIDLDGLDAMIEGELQRIDELEGEVGERRRALEALSGGLGKAATLVRRAAPRYYRPNDPVVVFAGDGIVGPPPDARDAIACAPGGALPEADARLEVALPDPLLGRLVGLALARAPELPEPDIALRTWALPWRPVELAWRVAMQLPDELDTSHDLPPDVVLDHHRLRPGGLDFDPPDSDFDALADDYEGRVPLTANASAALESQLAGLIDEATLQALRDAPLVAQALGGFTQALAMLDQDMQLPVADPDGSPLDAPFVARVAKGVQAQWHLAPLPENPFAPLRSGRFRVAALRLIDEFGRWRDVDVPSVAVSETIPQRAGAMMPPLRLTQPAQLRFRWRVAGRPELDASSLPAASPICAWVVPDRLDGALILYAGDGAAVGRLTPAGDGEPPVWFGAPGSDDPLAHAGVLLRAFRDSFADSGHLAAFSAVLSATRPTIAPSFTAHDQAIAQLLGEPLVLAQAQLDLSLLGLPLMDMRHTALRDDVARGDPLQRTTRRAEHVRFPVRLGNLRSADDGLIGFFLGTDFSRFYADAAPDGGHPAVVAPAPDTITLAAAPDVPPVTVTMLLDPRCEVHAATGILPVKALTIPGDLTARGLEALSYTFLTGPLLVGDGPVGAPAPAAVRWRWVSRSGREWHDEPLAPFDPTLIPTTRQRVVDGWLKIDR